jgi:protein SCO1
LASCLARLSMKLVQFLFSIALLPALLAGERSLVAQIQRDLPEAAEGIGVDQKVGDRLPLDVIFDDDKGNRVLVSELFDGKRPVVLSFNYSNCPQLCIVQLNLLASALQQIDYLPGEDFVVVSVGIDPNEQISRIAEVKRKFVAAYGKPSTADGIRFLRGNRDNIERLADACGYRYKYLPDQKQFSHPAAFIFCTPDGRIARYLDGLSGDLDKTLKPALVEAGEGRIGTIFDKFMYFSGCYMYDPATGKYASTVMGLVRIGGLITVLLLVVTLVPYWFFRRTEPAGAFIGNQSS